MRMIALDLFYISHSVATFLEQLLQMEDQDCCGV